MVSHRLHLHVRSNISFIEQLFASSVENSIYLRKLSCRVKQLQTASVCVEGSNMCCCEAEQISSADCPECSSERQSVWFSLTGKLSSCDLMFFYFFFFQIEELKEVGGDTGRGLDV